MKIITLFLLVFTKLICANPSIETVESILQLDTYLSTAIKAFNGIIFEDFYAQPNTQRFNGSLAVGETFSSDGFIVNVKNASEPAIPCINNTTSLDQIGLFVSGDLDAKNTTVNGALIVASSSNNDNDAITNVGVTSSSCVGGPVSLDFQVLFRTALNISQFLSEQVPNLVLRDGGYLSDGQYLGKDVGPLYTLTFCDEHCSSSFEEYLYSDPKEIFLGSSNNWTGPYNTDYLVDKPIVFNIPIRSGTVFYMSTDNPAAGLENAFVIYNIYPITEQGDYDPSGHIVWIRNTTYTIDGFILAPNVRLIENTEGGLTGNLIASRYLSVQDINNEIIRFFTN